MNSASRFGLAMMGFVFLLPICAIAHVPGLAATMLIILYTVGALLFSLGYEIHEISE